MNFYDFFIFITRFALANITQIFLLQNVKDAASNSSIKADHFVCNLKSIHAVASRMTSVDAFAPRNLSSCSVENRSAFSDVKKILKEESFHQLCAALLKTYEYIHGQGNNTEMRNSNRRGFFRVADDITAFISEICGPEDLVRLIEYALQKSTVSSDAFNSSLHV